jgi:ribosomal protein S18 acetylase RimI-like enzyme
MGSTGGGHFYRGLLMRAWPDILLALLRRPGAILRAVNVAGHIATVPDQAELMSIVVRPDFRGRDVAKRLLEDFRRELQAAGAKCFFVIGATTQPAALRFYKKSGGEVVAESTLGGLNILTFRYDCTSC